MSELSPRVNSARLPDHIGQIVRVTCKFLRGLDDENVLIVQTSDGGEIKVKPMANFVPPNCDYLDVVGRVQSADTVMLMSCIPMGNNLDMDLVNFVVEKWHDPRFEKLF